MNRVASRRLVRLAGVALAVTLVVLAVVVSLGRANRQQADDPRSTTPAGAGALGALLAQEGVRITPARSLDEALAAGGPGRALVVANGEVLDEPGARSLLGAGYGRVILLRPTADALQRFGVRASSRAPGPDRREAGCPVGAATLAGSITVADARSSYLAIGPADFACYPGASGGSAYLRVGTDTGASVDLVAGGISNELLGEAGNAAFGMNVFGAQAEVSWLMARPEGRDGPDAPSLLPPWWPIALTQAAVAFGVAAVWRGRRLGPILVEPLPVTVRAAETVEGHGRLYHRLDAYDRAADALRSGTVARLSRTFGHAEDPLALSAAVAARTGRGEAQVRALLFDARPASDDDLVDLARDLDRLEQEARRL